jgi:hypothetical protein
MTMPHEYHELDAGEAGQGELLAAVDAAENQHRVTLIVENGERIAVMVPMYWGYARELRKALAGLDRTRVTSTTAEEAIDNVISAGEALLGALNIVEI